MEHVDPSRLRDVARRIARRDHIQRRPPDENNLRWWEPGSREAYHEERARLGDCAPDKHLYRRERVAAVTPGGFLRARPLGTLIEVCERCGCWQDHPR